MVSYLMELSRSEVDALIIAELQRRNPGALCITIDLEPRTEKGFCHCWWIPSGDGSGRHVLNTLADPAVGRKDPRAGVCGIDCEGWLVREGKCALGYSSWQACKEAAGKGK